MQSAITLSTLARSSVILLASSLAWAGPQETSSGAGQAAQDSQQVIQEWPDSSKKAANTMIEKYGQPDGVTDSRLVWLDNGPWVRTVVYKEEIQHNFPVLHKDVLEQFINYEVPAEKFSELAKYDGSVVAYRTNGELSARCDKEAANILALNLAHDIIEGTRSVEEARAHYARTMQQVMNGEKPEIVQSLQFETRMASATRDPDEQFDLSGRTAQATSGASSAMQGSEEDELIQSARLTGMTVVSADGEEVGEITEVMDKAGEEIVRIQLNDGFLGIGASELTLPVSELSLTPDDQVKTELTRDELKSMAEPQNTLGGQGDDIEQ